MISTAKFETALAAAESWASIGRHRDAAYWIGTVALENATTEQLIRAAACAMRGGDTDVSVALMERAAAATRVRLSVEARAKRARETARFGDELARAIRASFQGFADAAAEIGKSITGLHDSFQPDFRAAT